VIDLTPLAATKVREIMADVHGGASYLRLFVAGRTCCSFAYGLALDRMAEPNDTVIEIQGLRVTIDEASRPFVEGARVDYLEGAAGAGFSVTNPSVSGSCGCAGR
jgi:iron-sulfur cluster assembly accessory protein